MTGRHRTKPQSAYQQFMAALDPTRLNPSHLFGEHSLGKGEVDSSILSGSTIVFRQFLHYQRSPSNRVSPTLSDLCAKMQRNMLRAALGRSTSAAAKVGSIAMRSHKFGGSQRALRGAMSPDPATYRIHSSGTFAARRRARNLDFGEPRPREPSERPVRGTTRMRGKIQR